MRDERLVLIIPRRRLRDTYTISLDEFPVEPLEATIKSDGHRCSVSASPTVIS